MKARWPLGDPVSRRLATRFPSRVHPLVQDGSELWPPQPAAARRGRSPLGHLLEVSHHVSVSQARVSTVDTRVKGEAGKCSLLVECLVKSQDSGSSPKKTGERGYGEADFNTAPWSPDRLPVAGPGPLGEFPAAGELTPQSGLAERHALFSSLPSR